MEFQKDEATLPIGRPSFHFFYLWQKLTKLHMLKVTYTHKHLIFFRDT